MWNKGKIDPTDTVNMCNQFILIHLIKKIKMSEARGGSQYTSVYRNAINSVKKYPLPIICRAQLESIHGIGDSLCEDLEKLIKKHYSAYLNPDLSTKSNEKQNNLNNQKENKQQIILIQKNQQDEKIEEDSKSSKSIAIQYKPRVNSMNAYFLQKLKVLTLTNINGLVEKEKIKEQIKEKYSVSKSKVWEAMISILQSNGYIIVEIIVEENNKTTVFYKLTEKGEKFVKVLDEKQKSNFNKSKMMYEVKQFKVQVQEKSNNLSNEGNSKQDQFNENNSKFTLRQLKLSQNQKQTCYENLQLIIDNRERKQKNQSNFFLQKIVKKYNLKCKTSNLTLGDFLWVYKDKVLNFIVQRKKADDLASSIVDGRYKDQKYRLKNCGISNVYYIYQGHPSQSCNLPQKALNNALLRTQLKENFKIFKTQDVNQTFKLLNGLHQQIYQVILKGQASYLCTIDEFIQENTVHKNLTVEKMFGLGLMTIPGIGKKAINTILMYYKTYRCMYDYLKNKFTNDEERINFLKQLFKGTGMTSNLPKILVTLLFSKNYLQDAEQQKQIVYEKIGSQVFEIIQRDNTTALYNRKQRTFSIIREQQQINQEQINL